jgi:hypothetical protein
MAQIMEDPLSRITNAAVTVGLVDVSFRAAKKLCFLQQSERRFEKGEEPPK